MPLKIIRNDITKMETEAIVNTANQYVTVGQGCDIAIYEAAGYLQLLEYRKKYIQNRTYSCLVCFGKISRKVSI